MPVTFPPTHVPPLTFPVNQKKINKSIKCLFRLWWPPACRQGRAKQSPLPPELPAWFELFLACDGNPWLQGFSHLSDPFPDSRLWNAMQLRRLLRGKQ